MEISGAGPQMRDPIDLARRQLVGSGQNMKSEVNIRTNQFKRNGTQEYFFLTPHREHAKES
jgi:hypothetical protein